MATSRQPRIIRLIKGDTGPAVRLSITDPDAADAPIDFSPAGTTVQLEIRLPGSGGEEGTLISTINCSKLTGRVLEDGTIDVTVPYNVSGAGGRVQVDAWPAEVTAEARSLFGWVKQTFENGLIETLKRPLSIVVLTK